MSTPRRTAGTLRTRLKLIRALPATLVLHCRAVVHERVKGVSHLKEELAVWNRSAAKG